MGKFDAGATFKFGGKRAVKFDNGVTVQPNDKFELKRTKEGSKGGFFPYSIRVAGGRWMDGLKEASRTMLIKKSKFLGMNKLAAAPKGSTPKAKASSGKDNSAQIKEVKDAMKKLGTMKSVQAYIKLVKKLADLHGVV